MSFAGDVQVQNWQLLLCYGFAVENNPFDTADISLEAPDDDDIGVRSTGTHVASASIFQFWG
jgi:hypothetical protein